MTLSVAKVAALVVALGACGGSPNAPELLARTRATPPVSPEVGEAVERVTFGDWYEVPVDPAVAAPLLRAHRLDRKGKRRDAIRVLNAAVEELPPSPALYEARGALYAAVGFRRGAAREFQLATELAPGRASAWAAMGRLRQELGLATTAIQALGHAHELGADGAELHLSWARALRRRRERAASARHYDLGLARLEDPSTELLIEVASLYYEALPVDPDPLERACAELGIDARRGQAALVRALLEDRSATGELDYLRESRVDRDALATWARVTLRALELDGAGDAPDGAGASR